MGRVLALVGAREEGRDFPLCGRDLLVQMSLWKLCGSFPVRAGMILTTKILLEGTINEKEDQPKCDHGEDCLVQMKMGAGVVEVVISSNDRLHGYLLVMTLHFSHMIMLFHTTYKHSLFSNSLLELQRTVALLGG